LASSYSVNEPFIHSFRTLLRRIGKTVWRKSSERNRMLNSVRKVSAHTNKVIDTAEQALGSKKWGTWFDSSYRVNSVCWVDSSEQDVAVFHVRTAYTFGQTDPRIVWRVGSRWIAYRAARASCQYVVLGTRIAGRDAFAKNVELVA
jgi:hypothetical protein